MKSSVYNIILGIVLYIYLFNPIFKSLGFSLMLLVYPFALYYSVSHYRQLTSYLKFYKANLIISVVAFVWVYFRTILSGGDDNQTAYNLLMWISFTTIFVPFFLVEGFLKKRKIDSIWNTFLNVGFIAAVITILCAVDSSINRFITDIQVEVESKNITDYVLRYRNFGLASGLTNTYGYVQGTFASVCILMIGKRNSFKYYLYFIAFAVAAAINARTGLFPILITLVYKTFQGAFKLGSFNILKIVFLIIVSVALFFELAKMFPDQANFIVNFFETLSDIYYGNEDAAYRTNWIFPKELSGVMCGEGRSLFGMGDVYGYGSDIGYVNQMFIGGLIFMGLLLCYVIILYKTLWKSSHKEILPIILFFSAIIFNYKGYAFYATSGFNRLVMLYYFVILYNYMASRKLKSCIRS